MFGPFPSSVSELKKQGYECRNTLGLLLSWVHSSHQPCKAGREGSVH
jgi:hypothetical protein